MRECDVCVLLRTLQSQVLDIKGNMHKKATATKDKAHKKEKRKEKKKSSNNFFYFFHLCICLLETAVHSGTYVDREKNRK